MKVIKTIPAYIYLLLFTPIFGVICIASAIFGDTNGVIWWPVSQMWARLFLKVSGSWRITVGGQHNIDPSQIYIIMSNHESHLDPLIIIRTFDKPVRFIVKKSLQWIPMFGIGLTVMGHIFMDRSGSKKALEGFKKAANQIAGGKTVLVFPEGSRGDGGELLTFKNGGFLLALRSKVTILPIGIAGSGNNLPRGWFFENNGPIHYEIGEPIPTDSYTIQQKGELMERVQADIDKLRCKAALQINERTSRPSQLDPATNM
jgi:1-acyl-sn-glycerol-3-phosphate acyltransferase